MKSSFSPPRPILPAVLGLAILLSMPSCKTAEEEALAPDPTAVSPSFGDNTGTVAVTVSGTGFASGAVLKIMGSAGGNGPILQATSVTTSGGTTITGTFDLTGRPTGWNDLVVINPDGKLGALEGGFKVSQPTVLFVAGGSSKTVPVFNAANTLSGPVTPSRKLITPAFGFPQDISLDSSRLLLYVTNAVPGKVTVFAHPETADGTDPPCREIRNSSYPGWWCSATLDEGRDQLYVIDADQGVVLIFGNVSTQNSINGADVAPSRILSGPAFANALSLSYDAANDRLFVGCAGDASSHIQVIDAASGKNGPTTPDRTITGPLFFSTRLYDIWVDGKSDRLYVAAYHHKQLLCYDHAATANGDTTPAASIPFPGYPQGLWYDPLRDLLYVSYAEYLNAYPVTWPIPGGICVFAEAKSLTSASAPARTITGLTDPRSLWGSND
ncbi:MAG TPA: hypothetical protein PKK12_00125 [Candidatus Aminicenantes bacterium]|nr:hypothetical protein [Candidatus Aminicenantes bacterium]